MCANLSTNQAPCYQLGTIEVQENPALLSYLWPLVASSIKPSCPLIELSTDRAPFGHNSWNLLFLLVFLMFDRAPIKPSSVDPVESNHVCQLADLSIRTALVNRSSCSVRPSLFRNSRSDPIFGISTSNPCVSPPKLSAIHSQQDIHTKILPIT